MIKCGGRWAAMDWETLAWKLEGIFMLLLLPSIVLALLILLIYLIRRYRRSEYNYPFRKAFTAIGVVIAIASALSGYWYPAFAILFLVAIANRGIEFR
jgi:heme/copper-type cytochrome/quinol oxidase subunit 2